MYRVIIADDEPKVLLLIKSLIQWDELGLELVATASDGIGALAMIEAHRPDIVITDIRMPGYDGIELIGKAKQLNPRIDFIIISGYRHFDYAQKAIRFGVEDYLLKPLKAVEINQTLRKMIAKYGERDQERDHARQREEQYTARLANEAKQRQEQFIALLLGAAKQGKLADAPEGFPPVSLEHINRDFGLALKAEFFQAFVVKADMHFESLNANVRKLLTEKSLGVIKDALNAKCHECLLYPTERGIYGLANFGEAQRKGLRKAMGAIIDQLQSQGELFDRIRVSIGLGRQTAAIDEAPASMKEAECAVANRLVFGAGRIIERTEGQDAPQIVNQIISANVRATLLKGVEFLDEAEIRAAFEGVANLAAAHERISGKALYAIGEECLHILHFGLRSQNAVDERIESLQTETAEKLGMCSAQAEIFQLLGNHASHLIAHVAALKKSEHNKPVREAQKYIQDHFNSHINLESVSQHAGFNPSYFSWLFKKETGMNFLEYLIDIRIKEAKRMLSDPRKTVADVAEDVGYTDVKHFSKLFTRITGIHPSQYRKLYY